MLYTVIILSLFSCPTHFNISFQCLTCCHSVLSKAFQGLAGAEAANYDKIFLSILGAKNMQRVSAFYSVRHKNGMHKW